MKHLLVLSVTVILCLTLSCCNTGNEFEGNKISNADSFQMDYSVLNQSENAFLTLAKGSSLQVSILQKAGTVDITVGIDGKEPIYEGNSLVNANFTLNISESGTYHIFVIGHNACGNVSFKK